MIGVRENLRGHMPPPLSDRAVRLGRERAAQEAQWEAQLRKMASHKAPESRIFSLPTPVRTLLDVLSGRKRHDTILLPRTLPVITGSETEDLACGKCGNVIAARVSRDSVRGRHPEGDRLVVRCTCRALNLLSSTPGIRSGYRAGQTVRVHPGTGSPGPRPGPCGVRDDPISTALTRKTSKLCYSLRNGSR